MSHLVDANVLIALMIREHAHHLRAAAWMAEQGDVASCAVVEGAFVRFMVRTGERTSTAQGVLSGLRDDERWSFVPETLSYADIDMDHVVGHRQVTDAYLAALAVADGRTLATLDEALVAALPDQCVLVPPLPGS